MTVVLLSSKLRGIIHMKSLYGLKDIFKEVNN